MNYLQLSIRQRRVTLLLKTGWAGLEINVKSLIAWGLEMEYLSIQSMQTMQYLPQINRKFLRYGVSSIVAIATSAIAVVVYA